MDKSTEVGKPVDLKRAGWFIGGSMIVIICLFALRQVKTGAWRSHQTLGSDTQQIQEPTERRSLVPEDKPIVQGRWSEEIDSPAGYNLCVDRNDKSLAVELLVNGETETVLYPVSDPRYRPLKVGNQIFKLQARILDGEAQASSSVKVWFERLR